MARCDHSDKSTFLLNHNRRRSIMWVFHLVNQNVSRNRRNNVAGEICAKKASKKSKIEINYTFPNPAIAGSTGPRFNSLKNRLKIRSKIRSSKGKQVSNGFSIGFSIDFNAIELGPRSAGSISCFEKFNRAKNGFRVSALARSVVLVCKWQGLHHIFGKNI